MSKAQFRATSYDVIPFHAIRASSFASSAIVAGILISFFVQLKSDGFKIPWAILAVMLASILNLVTLVLSGLLYFCGKLSPLLNMIVNIPLAIIWIVALVFLSWNITGTLTHSCTVENWGNEDGIRVCSIYKALYSFIILGTLSQIAHIVLDVRARRYQNRLGKYAKMADATDIKMEPAAHGYGDAYLHEQTRDEMPGWRPGANNASLSNVGSDRYGDSRGPSHMSQFDFGIRPQAATYNSSAYYPDNANQRY